MKSSRSTPSPGSQLGNWFAGALLVLFGLATLAIAYGYIGFEPQGFLMGKSTEIRHNWLFQIGLLTHAFTAPLAMILAALILQPYVRMRALPLHQKLGKVYAFLVLGLAAPSGLLLAFYSDAILAFALLAVAWWITTWLGYRAGKRFRIANHRKWMLRGFALLLSAVTLRIYLSSYVILYGPPTAEAYQLIAWASWVPNLLAILGLQYGRDMRATKSI